MSIPPSNKPSDYDKFLNRYLADLNLQVKLNQQNYDANVQYFKQGIQQTERTDSRSIEQRSQDVETLKIQARAMLNKLTDSNSADEVLNFLINNNLLFFFVQNFVDFERSVTKRYVDKNVSAPILRVLIQKSFDKQNEEIPILKDELIITTNSVASRDIIKKLLDSLYYTNYSLYKKLSEDINLFPTMEEKLNIVKFPEKKFKDEVEIMSWKDLPNNKQIEELVDLYEQLNTGTSQNIQSTQDQINNLEESIETQMNDYLYTYKGIDNLETSEVKKQIKEQEKADKELFKDIGERGKYNFDKILVTKRQNKFQGMKPPEGYIKKSSNRGSYTDLMNSDIIEEFNTYPELPNPKIMTNASKGSTKFTSMKEPMPPKTNKGSYKQETIYASPAELSSKTISTPMRIVTSAKNPPIPPKTNKGSYKQETIYANKIEEEAGISELDSLTKGSLSQKIFIPDPKIPNPEELEEPEEYIFSSEKTIIKKLKPKIEPLLNKILNDDNISPTDIIKDTNSIISDMDIQKLNIVLKLLTNARTKFVKDSKKTTMQYNEDLYDDIITKFVTAKQEVSNKKVEKISDKRAVILSSEPMEGKGLLTKRQQDIHRFKVLQGEILAGNNSKKIILELKSLILKMNKLGEISNKKASEVLQELNLVLK